MTGQHPKGFTLIEVMLALGLGALTLGAMYTIYLAQSRNQIVQEDIVEMQQTARAVMALLVRELNMAGFDPRGVNRDATSANDFFGVTGDATQLTIKADLNGNGRPTNSNESIVYSYDAATSTIRRNTGGGRQPVGEHIKALTFQYLDNQGRPTTMAKKIRQVSIMVKTSTKRPDPRYSKNHGFRTFTLRLRVTPRNLSL